MHLTPEQRSLISDIFMSGPFAEHHPPSLALPVKLVPLITGPERPMTVLHIVRLAAAVQQCLWSRPLTGPEFRHIATYGKRAPDAQIPALAAISEAASRGYLQVDPFVEVTTEGHDLLDREG
jgi:hypothetical protein